MSYRHLLVLLLGLVMIVSVFSCKKDNISSAAIFYGKWKTSYGDTITFARQDGKNVIYYFNDLNPGPGVPGAIREYAYFAGTFQMKYVVSVNDPFFAVKTFKWVTLGKVFTIMNVEWFPYMSSISTFTFTKID